VIPAYNEEKDINECLKSLRNQSYKKIEIILVDDGSTDKTIDIARKYKIKILRQNHKGPGAARNFGTKHSKGKILIFIDADMHFSKDYIKNLINPIKKDKKIIGTTHDYEIAVNTDNKWSRLWGKVRVSRENAKKVKIFRAIRKDKFLELGSFDSKYGYADDQTFWFKYGIKPKVSPNTTCYHKNPETLSETYKQARWIGASWRERFKIFNIPGINNIGVIFFGLLLPIFILAKTIKTKRKNISFIDVGKFYSVKFYGYLIGLYRAVFLRKVWK